MLGIDNGERAGLKCKTRGPLGRRPESDRETRGAPSRATESHRPASSATAARIDVDVVRTAHEFALEGFAFPYGDVALLEFQLVVAQCAVRGGAEHRRVPGDSRAARRAAHGADSPRMPTPISRASKPMRGQLDGETGRLKSAAAQNVIAPDFLLDKTLSQLKLARARQRRATGRWCTSLAKRTKDMPGNYAAQAAKIAEDKVAPALDRQIAELEAHRRRATERRRRVEAAARRRVLRLGTARRHHHAHDAGRDPRARPGRTARAAVAHGRHPAGSKA